MFKIKRNLIFLYGEKARIKINELAGILNNSSQRMKYSLKVMEKEGIVYNPFCIFDYSYFGLILFRVYFKGAYISEKDKAAIIKKLSDNDYIVSIYELSGEFDLVIEIQAPNPSRFNKVLKEVTDLIPALRHYKTVLNLVTYIYPRFYLIKEEKLQSYVLPKILIGGDREIETFSQKEMDIIKNLLDTPKIRLNTLANKANLNIRTVKTIIDGLREKNVIKGFKHIIDTNKLNIFKFRLFLKLHNLSKEREAELTEYLLNTREVVQTHKTIGDWNLEIDIESPDKSRTRQLTMEIREKFQDIIETFNMMEFYHYYTRLYLPKYLFKEKEIEPPRQTLLPEVVVA